MRLWTLHPKYLDGSGLVSLWREALLAREVLRGERGVIVIILNCNGSARASFPALQ